MGIRKKGCKRTIKYLSEGKNPKIIKCISSSPEKVIKSICNAAVNVAKGDVVLNPLQKKLFASNRKFFDSLIREGEPVKKKKSILIQKGSVIVALVIPAILSAVLSSLGSRLFK